MIGFQGSRPGSQQGSPASHNTKEYNGYKVRPNEEGGPLLERCLGTSHLTVAVIVSTCNQPAPIVQKLEHKLDWKGLLTGCLT